jgi:hypothetical protein
MNWHTLASTLAGALITFSAILFTHVLDWQKRKRTQRKLIHALLQALYDEVESLVEMARVNAPPIETEPDGKPYERLFIAKQDYFTVYHANAALVMQIEQAELRHSIFNTYTRAKGLLDMVSVNRLHLERYHYLQSTFLKTKDASALTASENYHQMLIEIAAQLRKADTEFRRTATRLLNLLSAQVGQAQTPGSWSKTSERQSETFSAGKRRRGNSKPKSLQISERSSVSLNSSSI